MAVVHKPRNNLYSSANTCFHFLTTLQNYITLQVLNNNTHYLDESRLYEYVKKSQCNKNGSAGIFTHLNH